MPGRNSTTGVGEIKGTIRYMSPEQVRGDDLDPRSDLYGLGAVLLEMVTGRVPFEELRPVDVLQALAKGVWLDPDTRPEIARHFRDDGSPRQAGSPPLPEALREVFRKVLAPKPAGRYDTTTKVLEALRGLVQLLGARVGDEAVMRVIGELFPARTAQDKLEESHDMAEEKGGSDLDVFEGLAKKSVRPSNVPGSLPMSGPALSGPGLNGPGAGSQAAGPPSARNAALPAPVPPPPSLRSGGKTTLLGVPAPAAPTSTPMPLPPPASKPPVKTISGVMPALPPPTSTGGATPPPPPASTATPPPPPPPGKVATPPPPPPPPTKAAAKEAGNSAPPMSKAPNTLVAAVPPPPKPPASIGSAVGMPSEAASAEPAEEKGEGGDENTPVAGKAMGASANVDMDWEDEEESTHVFEKRKHAMNKGPRPAAGAPPASAPPAPVPPPARVGNAATLLMSSGGAAAPRSVPPPPAVPPPKTIVMETPAPPPAAPVAATATPLPPRRPSEEATVVRPREGSSSKLAVVLAALALVAVVGLAVFLLYPRKGDLRVTVKTKTGQPVAKADIFVDGRKVCETTPCLVSELDESKPHNLRVVIGEQVVADQSVSIHAGREEPVQIAVDDAPPVEKPSTTSTAVVASTAPTASTTAEPVSEGTGFRVSGANGVKVLVDGKERGVLGSSPVVLKDLTPGSHQVKFDGGEHYKSTETTVDVQKNKMVELPEVKPVVTKGQLTVELKTTGADIVLSGTKDGKKVEKKVDEAKLKKVTIPTDEGWKITVTKKGFEEFSEEIKFEDGAYEKTMTIELNEKGKAPKPGPTPPPAQTGGPKPPPPPPPTASGNGTLSCNSIPASNAIVDGRPVGKTPVVGLSVSAGKHTVTFRHPEKGSKSVTVDVKPGGKAVASVKFE